MSEPIFSTLTGKPITSVTVSGAPTFQLPTSFSDPTPLTADFNGTWTFDGTNYNKTVAGNNAQIVPGSTWRMIDSYPGYFQDNWQSRPQKTIFRSSTGGSNPPTTGWIVDDNNIISGYNRDSSVNITITYNY